ncbi:TonB-dependent receptor domain-containing protein [Propionivibrio limicola]|uniref:TonB-dependent receptor domain-containing protein n=1 Tax=Propionivibrio limicola TaxID=167645 RepID=UPI00147932CA|nr:TonB-dependent receptor [Propionivibrio limicola]
MYPRCSLAAGAIALMAAFPVMAAESEAETIVVTATRQAQRANELLADVSVISREEIEAAGQSSLPELLARQPGIEFTQSGSAGSTSSLFIRGTNSEHTLVLIDGMRVNSATLGTTALSRIPLAQVDRIEILRGPASSLYGSEAIGGVIQIFTRQGSGPAAFNLEAAYGSDATQKLSAGVSGQNEGWKYSLQAAYDDTNGFSNIRNKNNNSYNPDDDGFRDKSFSGNLAYRFNNDHEIGLNTFSSDGSNDYDGGYKASATKDYRNDIRVSSYSLYSRNRILPDWQSTVRLGRGTDDAFYYVDGVKASSVRTDQDQFSWQNDIALPLGKALLAAEWLRQDVEATQQYDKTERTIKSLLAGWGASAGNHRWQFNARHDDISQTGSKTTGSAAYGYQISDAFRAHASYGTAYKAPSMNDLYYPYMPYMGQGNPDLKPEYAHNREFALHYEAGPHAASVTYFHNRIDDLIQWEETPAGSWFYVPQNVSSARITGWSLAYKGSFGPLSLRAAIDLQDPRNTETDNLLTRRARKHANVGADYMTGAWTFGGEVVSSGERYNDVANTVRLGGYTLLNLTANYRIDRNVSLFARINNVFDKQYELVDDYGTAGVNGMVGIRYQPK